MISYEPFFIMLEKRNISQYTLENDYGRISIEPIEDKNRLIGILLFNANGYTNFKRSRNRIILFK